MYPPQGGGGGITKLSELTIDANPNLAPSLADGGANEIREALDFMSTPNSVIQLIKQVHPTLQVLQAVDETTFYHIYKDGDKYKLFTAGTFNLLAAATTTNKIRLENSGSFPSMKFDNIYRDSILVAGFTSGEGYSDGALNAQQGWVSNGFSVEASAGAGNVTSPANTYAEKTITASSIIRVSTWSPSGYGWGCSRTIKLFSDATEIVRIKVNNHAGTFEYWNGTDWVVIGDEPSPRDNWWEIKIEILTDNKFSLAIKNISAGDIDYTPVGHKYGNVLTAEIASDSAVLSFFKYLKGTFSNGGSTHATPVQAEIYGNADSYATALNSTTKFTITPASPLIELYRTDVSVAAKSAGQTTWVMDDNATNGALPAKTGATHSTILAEEIGVASIISVEKSILGDFSDTVVLTEGTDYSVDYSTRTATKIILASGTGITTSSKLRIRWIADVMKIDAATNNTAFKVKLYLNRTSISEASPEIQPLTIGTAKYVEMLYGV
jgi:hypothetical protein